MKMHEREQRLLAAMNAQPSVEFTSDRVAKIMEVQRPTLAVYTANLIGRQKLFKRRVGKTVLYSLTDNRAREQEPSDPGVAASRTIGIPAEGTNTGWKPPQMVCVREQSAAKPVITVDLEQPQDSGAFFNVRSGELVIVGLDPDDEGRITVPPDLVQAIRHKLAWMPA